jgi:thymidylate synthase (FAD)
MEAKLKVEILTHTPEPERIVATAGHMCYAGVSVKELKEKMDDEKLKKILGHLIEAGHFSVLEHASFTFAIEGVSRTLTHQLVRHRIASYSQQSQRYVNEENMNFVIPPSIKEKEGLGKEFLAFMEDSKKAYRKLIDAGIPKEDARFALPNAAETRIIMTMNARSLYNFFERRLCTRAQWEIRALAISMLEELKKAAPLLFNKTGPICDRLGYCPEKKSCGRHPPKEEAVKG